MQCSVLYCKNTNKGEHSLFSFPVEETRRRKWIEFCGQEIDFTKRAGICSAHFDRQAIPNDLKFRLGFCARRILSPGAVPTLHPELPPNEREARVRATDRKRIINDMLTKTQGKSALKTVAEDPLKLPTEFTPQMVKTKEFLSADAYKPENFIIQNDAPSVICVSDDEDEPLMDISPLNGKSTKLHFNQTPGKKKFNGDFPIVPRTIILPISTRGIGFIIRHLAAVLWRLQIKDVDVYTLTNALYRITLLQLDMKISTAMNSHYGRNTGGRAFINVVLPEPSRKTLEDLCVNFVPLESFISAIGFIKTAQQRYLPRYPLANADHPCDPVNVRFSLLRELVKNLSSEETPQVIRRNFYELNSIPGAVWDDGVVNEEGSVNPLLKNADDIMPAGYGISRLCDDCNLIKSSIGKIAEKYPKMVSWSGIDYRREGSMAQTVSSRVMSVRCPSFNVDKLTSVVGEYDHFWSLTNLSKEEFCGGVLCLVGETGLVEHQECMAPRMLESSSQEAELNYLTVVKSIFEPLL